MKKLFLFLFLFATAGIAAQSDAFIITIKTDNPGSSGSTSFTIPTTGTGYNYEVDWNNDGVYDQSGLNGNATWDYGTAGAYTIRIRGAFPRISFNFDGDRRKLLSIDQWGSIAWSSMERAFGGCFNMIHNATDAPNLSAVTSLENMFTGCFQFNGAISNWDVSNVTNMSNMFYSAGAFNQPIGNWDVSNVTNMSNMFYFASAFNQPIGDWNVENVSNMANMFQNASSFNQPIDNWNVSNVTNMPAMFLGASAFNQPIGNWNVGNVTNMYGMFVAASAFNQPIGNWDVSNVTNMTQMFSYASSFNQTLGNWTLNPNVNITFMLEHCGMDCLNYSATLIGWAANPATPNNRLLQAFGRQYGTNAVAARNALLAKGWSIGGDAPSGTVCGLPRQGDEFIITIKTDIIGLESSGPTSFTIPTYVTGSNYEVDWNDDGFYEQSGLTGSTTWNYGTAGTYTIRIRGAFPRISFEGGGDALKLLSIDQWGSIAWSSMEEAFYGCFNMTYNATDAPDLSTVTSMRSMFAACPSFNGAIGNWDVSNVTNMAEMFSGASSFNQPIGNWDVSNVTNMVGMFGGASSFNQPIGNWNVSNAALMPVMFAYASSFNQPIGNWNVSNVTEMYEMFVGALAFNQPIGNWNLNANVAVDRMLDNSGMDCLNYSATLIGWAANPATPNGRNFGAGGRQYGTNAVAARNTLLAKGWSISGDAPSGTVCASCPDLSAPTPAASVTNSACTSGCTVAGGSISAPAMGCPDGATLQYSTDGGATWSTDVPAYNQTGPAQTILTRCLCEGDNNVSSPWGSVTTAPGACIIPATPAFNIANGACPPAPGGIAATGCGPGTTVEYATDPAGPWSATAPDFTGTTLTVYARCRDTYTGCTGDNAMVTVAPKSTVSFISVSPNARQYSDEVTFTATIQGGASCLPQWQAAQYATFFVGAQNMGSAEFEVQGNDLVATLSDICLLEGIEGQMAPGAKSVSAVFHGIDDFYYAVSQPAAESLQITPENATVAYNGLEYFSTPSPSNCTGIVTLMAYAGDDTDPAQGCRGDIRNATITFSNGNNPGTTLGAANLPVGLVNPGNLQEGIAVNTFEHTLASANCNKGGEIFEVWARAGNYYEGQTSTLTLVTLALPGNDYVSGGGHLVLSNSAGTYAGTAGSKMNFGFNMKWNSSGKNLQGRINIIFRRLVNGEWRTYQIMSNAINSMAQSDPADYRRAVISTKANLTDVTNPNNPVSLGGNLNLAMNAWEHKTVTNGSLDQISVTLSGSGSAGLLFASHWSGSGAAMKIIGGGKIKVRSNATGSSLASPSLPPHMAQGESQVQVADWESAPVGSGAILRMRNQPNPFQGETDIWVEMNAPEMSVLRIFDNTGRPVQVLHEGMLDAGLHRFRFDAGNLPVGFYYYTLNAGGEVMTGKMLLAR